MHQCSYSASSWVSKNLLLRWVVSWNSIQPIRGQSLLVIVASTVVEETASFV